MGDGGPWRVSGARELNGSSLSFGVVGSELTAARDTPREAVDLDLGGRTVVAAFIDSHVHLAYYDVAEQLPAGGVVAAVDFAEPLESLASPFAIDTRRSGPMLTPPGGYPTRSWGSAGFGLEVASVKEAEAAVDQLLDLGADFIKAPLLGDQGLSDELLEAVVARAHERGARVALHALGASDAERALGSDADILAHTPTDVMAAEALEQWSERTVVSTLAAFGGGQAALDNLRALAAAGARVLYGTDLGNTRQVGIQGAEIDDLMQAGFDGEQIVLSATVEPARFWGFDDLGVLEPGRRASFLVLDEDPKLSPLTLTTPRAVVADGVLVAGTLP